MNTLTLTRAAAAACLAVMATTTAAWAQLKPGLPTQPLELVVRQPPSQARMPVRLEAMAVRAELVGSVARTEVELTFHNPNAQVLEGELRFPLLEGQTVTGFALDIDGAMRSAVPVPKEQGRQVFDDVTRRRVDPALLQATQGQNYSLRVYPLAANGSRRVRLEITQSLDRERDAFVYRLPLAFSGTIGRLDAAVRVAGVADARTVSARIGSGAGAELVGRSDSAGQVVYTHSAHAHEGGGLLEVRRAAVAGVQASVQPYRGRTYFYAELPADPVGQAARTVPRRLGIVWDASGSARPAASRQLELLAEYFKRVRNTQVVLSVVRDISEPAQLYTVRDGNWEALRARLAALVYDGGTSAQLPALAPQGVDQVLVFTDGLLNYGRPTSVAPQVPTMAISASPSTDATLLRHIAERSGAEYVDLARVSTQDAVERLTRRRPRIVSIQGRGAAEFVMHSPYATDGSYRIGGVLESDAATVSVTTEDANGVRHKREIALAAATAQARGALPPCATAEGVGQGAARPSACVERQGGGVAAHQWATMSLAGLQAQPRLNERAIERLGLHFGLVTPRTSLIVLDTAADYARYQIEPPAQEMALAQAYQALVAGARDAERSAREQQLVRVMREFEGRHRWWQRDFPKDTPASGTGPARQGRGQLAAGPDQRRAMAESVVVPEQAAAAAPAPRAVAPVSAAPADASRKDAGSTGRGAGAPSSAIRLKGWTPDSRSARRMRAATGDEVYRVYIDERPDHLDSTAFFLDAADILAEKGQPMLAARVVSNLAEMNLENRHILRILAYRLTQIGAHDLAIPALERVLALAPDEPQSWRDLALAQAAAGQYQSAVDQLWRVVTTPWHGRFPNIEIVALTELNAILARAAAAQVSVDTRAIPSALLLPMPVGLRVTLAWDADNTDIDLYVEDPNGEVAFFGHRLTYQGGAMSPDFTGGYGPEEYSLKLAKPGRYKIRARFYGHSQQIVAPSTTLMLDFFTDYGTPQQKSQQVVRRLSGQGEIVDVGEFEVGERGH